MCIHRQSICSAGMKEMSRECRENAELADSIMVVCLWEQCAWHSYNGTARSKNVNKCLNTNIDTYLETSGGQSYNLYLNVVHFFNTSVN
jgi:hypothetical protein